MKKLSTLFLLLILIGCSKSEFNIEERNDDINSIITTIIKNDSIKVFKNNSENNKIVQFLKKVKIVIPNPNKNIITPPNRNEIEMNELLDFEFKKYFNKNDSLYLLSQNINSDSLEISDKLKENYNYAQLSNILKDRDEEKIINITNFRFQYFRKIVKLHRLN